MPGHKRAHYRGDYARRSAVVRAHAYSNPLTKCWRCGRTLDEVRATNPTATWQAGHLVDGAVNGDLRAECQPCNSSAGASMGNRKREPRSRRWQ
jgi:5-methylcytosine-specific restriction endonuclease McrA